MDGVDISTLQDHEPEAPFDPLKYPVRLIGAQLAVATSLGVTALVTFCVLRRKYPQLYEARRARRRECFFCFLFSCTWFVCRCRCI